MARRVNRFLGCQRGSSKVMFEAEKVHRDVAFTYLRYIFDVARKKEQGWRGWERIASSRHFPWHKPPCEQSILFLAPKLTAARTAAVKVKITKFIYCSFSGRERQLLSSLKPCKIDENIATTHLPLSHSMWNQGS